MCDNHEVLNDEKRKRTGEDEGSSKRPNMRNMRKKEVLVHSTRKEVVEMSTKA